MKSFISLAALAATASAAALQTRQSSNDCCFGITVTGAHQSGSLGQLTDPDDGQNRVGPGYGGASYCLSGTTITDSKGRGCVIAMPDTQFECHWNSPGEAGFTVSSSGDIAYNGNTTFYECAATADNQYNIYTTPAGAYCAPVTLTTTGGSSCAAASSSTCSAVTSTITQVSTATIASTATVTASFFTTAQGSTVYQTAPGTTLTEAVSSVVTLPGTTIYQTASGTTITETISSVITASGTTITETVSSVVTTPGTTVTAPGTTITQYMTVTAPGSTVVKTQTQTTEQTTTTTAIQTTTPPVTPSTTTLSTTSTTPSTTSATACPSILNNAAYQYPHLIVPVSSTKPTTAYGTQYFGYVNSVNSTIFNFDIPTSYSGKTCSVIFLLPELSQLETSSYTLTGSGSISFSQLTTPATQSTTYANTPATEKNLGTFSVQPGSNTVVATGPCAAGETVAYEMKATGSYALQFFQDYNPCPLGLYVESY